MSPRGWLSLETAIFKLEIPNVGVYKSQAGNTSALILHGLLTVLANEIGTLVNLRGGALKE